MAAKIRTDVNDSRQLFLAKFSNGIIKDSQRESLKCQLLSHKEKKKTTASRKQEDTKHKRMIVAESSKTGMTYLGKNFEMDTLNSANKSIKYCVGVFDEKRRKMRIYDTDLFHMKPHLPEAEALEAEEAEKNRSFVDTFGSLVDSFGSKRRKSAFDKKFKNQIDDKEIEGVMTADATHGKQQQSARGRPEEALDPDGPITLSTLPPCNKDAETVEQVYPLSIVITQTQMDALHTLSAEFFDSDSKKIKEWTTEKKYPIYILNHATTLALDGEFRWKQSKLLLYLHYMIKLYMARGNLNKSKVFNDLPAIIREKLFNNFTVLVHTTRCKPIRLKDRLVAYIIVLCLHIDDFYILDLQELIKDLHIPSMKLQHIVRALGARILKKRIDRKETLQAKLQLPLQFPTEGKKRGRR